MNELEISIHVNNSRLQIVQPEFTIWKYKVKLSAKAANRSVPYTKKLFLKIPQYYQENTCVGALFNNVEGLQVLRTPILKATANGCLVHNMSLKT